MNLDWQQIVLNIRNNGISGATIARKVGCHHAHILNMASGIVQEPKFSTGIKLLDMHYAVCRDKHDMKSLTRGERPRLRKVA